AVHLPAGGRRHRVVGAAGRHNRPARAGHVGVLPQGIRRGDVMTPKRDRRDGETPAGSPLHGYQGDRGAVRTVPGVPAALTIALSREAGARGGTIGRRVGRKLGWQVYGQDLLEYTAQESNYRPGVFDHLSEAQA